jgi:hypothetical protein
MILHDPARLFELAVNIDTRKSFRVWHGAWFSIHAAIRVP